MILDASKQVWVLDYQVPQKIILARIKVLVAKVPIVCAALDYQGGDSGQITSGGWGGEVKCLSGSCSLYKNRKLVLKFRVLFVFKFSVLRKAGNNNKGDGPCRESEKG